MPDTEPPLSYKKNAVFFLGDIYLISPCIWHLYNALFFLSRNVLLGKSTSWNDLARSKKTQYLFLRHAFECFHFEIQVGPYHSFL